MELDDDVDFCHLFTDPSHVSGYYIPNGYLQTNVSAICNMYKVMDPDKPEYTDMLDMLLYHKQRPFSNNDF